MQGEHLRQVGPGADDRADDRCPVQHGVEHRDGQRPFRRQRHQHKPATAAQATVVGFEGLGVDRQADGHVRAAVRLQHRRRVVAPGVDDDVGTQFPGQLQLFIGDVDRGHGRAEDLGVLQRQVTQTADTGDRHEIGRTDVPDLDCFVSSDPRARQRRGLERVDAVRDAGGEGRLGQEVLGVAAVHGVTGVALLLAQRLPAGQAGPAAAAGVAQPGHGGPLPHVQARHARTHRIDDADALMPGHERRNRLGRPVAVCGVNIGMAQPGGFHLDRDLPRPRLGNRPVLDEERAPELLNHCGLHLFLLAFSSRLFLLPQPVPGGSGPAVLQVITQADQRPG